MRSNAVAYQQVLLSRCSAPQEKVLKAFDLYRCRLLKDTQLFTCLRKGLNSMVQMVPLMRRGNLHTDTRLSLWYYREEEANHINAFFKHARSQLLRQHRIIKHDWCYR